MLWFSHPLHFMWINLNRRKRGPFKTSHNMLRALVVHSLIHKSVKDPYFDGLGTGEFNLPYFSNGYVLSWPFNTYIDSIYFPIFKLLRNATNSVCWEGDGARWGYHSTLLRKIDTTIYSGTEVLSFVLFVLDVCDSYRSTACNGIKWKQGILTISTYVKYLLWL